MALTPGQYLRKRREAAELSLDDVALCFETIPPIAARARAEWLQLIEADAVPLPAGIGEALAGAFAFDAAILAELARRFHEDSTWIAIGIAVCRACGCSEYDPCAEGCAWAPGDMSLCTRCEERGVGGPEIAGLVPTLTRTAA